MQFGAQGYGYFGDAPAPRRAPPPPPTCAYNFRDAPRIELEAARRVLSLSGDVSRSFIRSVGALDARGRFTPTILDNKYWFAKLYEFITYEEIRAIGQFRHPAFVMHFIPHFYGLYYDALKAWNENRRSAVGPLWTRHFTLAGRPDVSGVVAWASGVRNSIVSGATAHIQGDMVTALERAYRSYVAKYCLSPPPRLDDFRPDFFETNRIVFDRAKADLLLDAARYSPFPFRPEMGQFVFAMGEPLAGGLNVNDVYQWRENVWATVKRRLGQ